MRGQKLKTFSDFLKRAKIIPHAVLVITEDDSYSCVNAIAELRSKKFDIPFYELNLSDNSNLREELIDFYNKEDLPTFIYFRGNEMISKIVGFDKLNNFIDSLSDAINIHS